MLEDLPCAEIGERRWGVSDVHLLGSPRHGQRLAQHFVENRPGDTCIARSVPRSSQLCRDLPLSDLRGIEPAGHEKQVLDGGLACPGAKLAGRVRFVDLRASEAA